MRILKQYLLTFTLAFGAEMCIRDSSSRCSVGLSINNKTLQIIAIFPGCRVLDKAGVNAVIYSEYREAVIIVFITLPATGVDGDGVWVQGVFLVVDEYQPIRGSGHKIF